MTEKMWTEDIKPIGDVSAERIRAAVEKARDAFYASLAADFPEVTTGDMAPGVELELEWASNFVTDQWLRYNHPSTRYDEAGGDDCDHPAAQGAGIQQCHTCGLIFDPMQARLTD